MNLVVSTVIVETRRIFSLCWTGVVHEQTLQRHRLAAPRPRLTCKPTSPVYLVTETDGEDENDRACTASGQRGILLIARHVDDLILFIVTRQHCRCQFNIRHEARR